MNMFKMKGAAALLCFGLVVSMTSCHHHDDNYLDVQPPVIAEIHNISGSVAAIDGRGIANATVTLSGAASATAKTTSDGYFVFVDVKPGTYNLVASAQGKISKSTSVVVEDGNGKNVVWNVMLPSETAAATITVTPTTTAEDEVTTEALEGNDKAEVPVEVEIPQNSVNKDAVISVYPIYDEEDAVEIRSARSDENTMLVGATITCSDPSVQITSPLDLTFNVDSETAAAVEAKKFVNGDWIPVPCTVNNGQVLVEADEFTSYGVFLGVNFSVSTTNTGVSFTRDYWDNFEGVTGMYVAEAAYKYGVGTKIESSGTTVFTALLIEALARRFGANTFTATGTYPMNVTLPIGCALRISGTQQINRVSASAKGRTVSGTQYGTVTVVTTTYNRNHTGSSN